MYVRSVKSHSRFLRWSAAVAIVASIGIGAAPYAHADNNSGTVKLSQDGTVELPSGGSNEPHVCLPFYVQGYGLDANAHYTIKFFNQGGPNNGSFVGSQLSPTSDGSGNFSAKITSTSLTGSQLADGGHYKVDVFDTTGNEVSSTKDKSKVFKVECGNTSETLTATPGTTCSNGQATVSVLLADTTKQNGNNGINKATLTYSFLGNSGTAKLSTTTGQTNSQGQATLSVSDLNPETVTVQVAYSFGSGHNSTTGSDHVDVSFTACPPGGGIPDPGTNTPELSSGELLATGVLPILGIYLYRRRRRTDD